MDKVSVKSSLQLRRWREKQPFEVDEVFLMAARCQKRIGCDVGDRSVDLLPTLKEMGVGCKKDVRKG